MGNSRSKSLLLAALFAVRREKFTCPFLISTKIALTNVVPLCRCFAVYEQFPDSLALDVYPGPSAIFLLALIYSFMRNLLRHL